MEQRKGRGFIANLIRLIGNGSNLNFKFQKKMAISIKV
jgi:hypothetical protein